MDTGPVNSRIAKTSQTSIVNIRVLEKVSKRNLTLFKLKTDTDTRKQSRPVKAYLFRMTCNNPASNPTKNTLVILIVVVF